VQPFELGEIQMLKFDGVSSVIIKQELEPSHRPITLIAVTQDYKIYNTITIKIEKVGNRLNLHLDVDPAMPK